MDTRTCVILGVAMSAFACDRAAPYAYRLFPSQEEQLTEKNIVSNWRRDVRETFEDCFPDRSIRRWVVTKLLWENMWIPAVLIGASFTAPDSLFAELASSQKVILVTCAFFSGCLMSYNMKRMGHLIRTCGEQS